MRILESISSNWSYNWKKDEQERTSLYGKYIPVNIPRYTSTHFQKQLDELTRVSKQPKPYPKDPCKNKILVNNLWENVKDLIVNVRDKVLDEYKQFIKKDNKMNIYDKTGPCIKKLDIPE